MQVNTSKHRAGERGAAMIMALLVSTLVLASAGALLVATSTSAKNSIDAAAERQAYYAAEAGLQTAVNALRGNMPPDGAVPAGTRMSFRAAVTPDASNGAGRNATDDPCGREAADDSRCRLAGWLPYDDPDDEAGSVPVGSHSFRVNVFDPDDSHKLSFSTAGAWRQPPPPAPAPSATPVPVSIAGSTITIGAAPAQTVITYFPPAAPADVPDAVPSAVTPFGRFEVRNAGPLVLDADTVVAGFDLRVTQSLPWGGEEVVRATLRTPAAGGCADTSFELVLDRPVLKIGGAVYAVDGLINKTRLSLPCTPASESAAASLNVTATASAPQPRRLVLRSRGYGPKWAEKRLELTVDRLQLEGEFPAAVTMRGAEDCSAPTIDTGSSGAKTYTGADRDGVEGVKPAFAVTACDVDDVESGIKKHDTAADPEIGVLGNAEPPAGATTSSPSVPVPMPAFLETADAARALLDELEAEARAQNRYFKPASSRTVTNADGTTARPGFTFVDGDCVLDTSGGAAGLLVVTGNLEMNGNPSFDGVVLVLGGGTVNRDGGGSGVFSGAIIVARFARAWPASEDGQPHPFLAPTFNTNGGGSSTVQNSSVAITSSLAVLGGPRFRGFLEF